MTTEGPAGVRGKREDSNGSERAVGPTTDLWAASVERKQKRDQDIAHLQEAPPHAKQRREDDGTERSTDRQAERSCKQQNNGTATEPVTLLANEAKAEKKKFPICLSRLPKVCDEQNTNGPGIDHRRACGNRFQVWDAQVVAKGYVYICPACKGNVASDVKTGQIDHRTVCGNKFSVQDGVVKEKAYVYVWPACKGNVASDVKAGQIDYRTVCGNKFSVKDGAVKEKAYV